MYAAAYALHDTAAHRCADIWSGLISGQGALQTLLQLHISVQTSGQGALHDTVSSMQHCTALAAPYSGARGQVCVALKLFRQHAVAYAVLLQAVCILLVSHSLWSACV